MTFVRKSGGSNITPTTFKRRSGSSSVNVSSIKRKSGGSWVTVWPTYTPISNVQHAAIGANRSGTAATGVVTAALTNPTWSGGNAGASVTWQVLTGSASISGGTTLTTGVAIAGTVSGTLRVTVSDGVSSSSTTVNYSLTYTRTQ